MDLITKGGPLMWLLLGCSIIAIAIFLERLFYFHRARIDVGDLLFGLRNLIKNKAYSEALSECAATPGPVARVIHSAIRRYSAPRTELKEIVQESGQLEVPKLEKHLTVLLTVAYIAPLIGLLGSVLGLVDTFVQINAVGGFATVAEISQGVYEALITSAAGLMVAIPSFVFYSHLRAYSRSLMHDMEAAGIEIVNTICDLRNQPNDIISMLPDSPSVEESPEPSFHPSESKEENE
ncbi:MAG: MotA/TolQ/ExbB proton channel family protein [Verrucomicrobiales bacterium]|nr:MotA/TolQ/ExbB proton channel family protein [Verrucomicrobiales bacterium]